MHTLSPPDDAVKSSSGITWLSEDGIIIAVASKQALHTLNDAIENNKINILLSQGKRRPFLIDISEVQSMTREARAFYSGPEPKKGITAVALLTKSVMGKVVANFFLKLTVQSVPTKMFTNFEEAKEWLLQYKE